MHLKPNKKAFLKHKLASSQIQSAWWPFCIVGQHWSCCGQGLKPWTDAKLKQGHTGVLIAKLHHAPEEWKLLPRHSWKRVSSSNKSSTFPILYNSILPSPSTAKIHHQQSSLSHVPEGAPLVHNQWNLATRAKETVESRLFYH